MNFPEIPYLYPARSIVIDGKRVAYIDVNPEGDDPVLFLHDLALDLNVFAGSYERLSPKRRVLGLDWIGFGKSDKPWLDDPVVSYTELVGRFLDEFSLDRVSLVGHSVGGLVAARFASEAPERVDRLVLIAPWGLGELSDDERATRLDAWSYDRLEQMDSEMRRAWFESMTAGWNDLLEERYKLHDELASSVQYRLWARAVERAAASALYHPLGARLERISAPTLVVWGLDDHIIPFEHASLAADGIAGAKVASIEHCGHLPMLEQPDALNDAIEAFMEGREAAAVKAAAPPSYTVSELEPWPGLSPEIGRLARMLFEQRYRCLLDTADFTYEQIAWRPSPDWKSTGELILGMGSIVVRSLYEVLKGGRVPEEVCSRFRLDPEKPGEPTEAPRWTAGRLMGEVEWAHDRLYEWLAERTDADLNDSFQLEDEGSGATLRWVFWTLVEETVAARGRIAVMARLLAEQ